MRYSTANASGALRIAMLSHSINPRGGVVHALQLSESLQDDGHRVTLLAPDPQQKGLFRQPRCDFMGIPGEPLAPSYGTVEMVRRRIDDYVRHFLRPDTPQYDIYHAQDSISANALATLTERGVIAGFVRTVHQFEQLQLHAWQERGFRAASQVLCVSRLWQEKLHREHGVSAEVVNNGVDLERYQAQVQPRDITLARELGLRGTPILLAVGGIEPRKNSCAILQAFVRLRRVCPSAQLIIAGGASLLDHHQYQQAFHELLHREQLSTGPGEAVIILGQVADEDMPALFRCADALVFPSLKEGFGLVVLEAMACGLPTVVSRIAPFTEYLQEDSCAWVDPEDPASIAIGMAQACDPLISVQLRRSGAAICQAFSWAQSAHRHLSIYRAYLAHNKDISYA